MVSKVDLRSMEDIDAKVLERTLEDMLKNWGIWRFKFITLGLGFSSMSPEGRLQRDGGVTSRGTKPPGLPDNPDAEMIDAWVNLLMLDSQEAADALKIHYSSIDDNKKSVWPKGKSDFYAKVYLGKLYLKPLLRAEKGLK